MLQDDINDLIARLERMKATAAEPPKPAPSNRKKLTRREVDRMRELYASGNFTVTQLAEDFDVNHGTASRILRRIYWR